MSELENSAADAVSASPEPVGAAIEYARMGDPSQFGQWQPVGGGFEVRVFANYHVGQFDLRYRPRP